MAKGICSICSSPVCEQVNEALRKGETLRALASVSGFSRAALSRHNRKCLPKAALLDYRSRTKISMTGRRTIVSWPSSALCEQKFTIMGQLDDTEQPVQIFPDQLKPSDVLLRIEFIAGKIRNPQAVLNNEELSDPPVK